MYIWQWSKPITNFVSNVFCRQSFRIIPSSHQRLGVFSACYDLARSCDYQLCVNSAGGICAVILYDSNTKVCINQKLVSLGLAEWEDSDESIDYTKSKSPVKPAPPVQATSTPNAASTTQAYKPSTKSSPSPVSFNQHNQSSNSKLNGQCLLNMFNTAYLSNGLV